MRLAAAFARELFFYNFWRRSTMRPAGNGTAATSERRLDMSCRKDKMLDSEKLSDLTSRLNRADYKTLPALCGHLIDYIEKNVSPYNTAYLGFVVDRDSKWKLWDTQVGRARHWELPASPADCASLAWHLISLIGETGEHSKTLLFSMYGQKHFDDNVRRFLSAWDAFIKDAINTIVEKEACDSSNQREKQQKFGILDSPTLFHDDVQRASGEFGRAAIFLDLDDFKKLNTRLTEVKVDELVLPKVHSLLRACTERLGFAYAEGGDEFLIFLPNASQAIAIAVAESVRSALETASITDEHRNPIRVTASVGVAHMGPLDDSHQLKHNANLAKQWAKENGRNRVAFWSESGCRNI
jgi:diguanylate cyclase (GGDEF)-like protein